MNRAENYRQRARELRSIAEKIENEETKKDLYKLAQEYEEIAKREESKAA
jgi:hypothetical protein